MQIVLLCYMQICMKATVDELGDLKRRIIAAKEQKGLSNAALASLANVDPSQVSRICSGSFATISANVVQICKALGLQVESVHVASGPSEAGWAWMEASLRSLWDRTPADAERISTLLKDVARLRRNR